MTQIGSKHLAVSGSASQQTALQSLERDIYSSASGGLRSEKLCPGRRRTCSIDGILNTGSRAGNGHLSSGAGREVMKNTGSGGASARTCSKVFSEDSKESASNQTSLARTEKTSVIASAADKSFRMGCGRCESHLRAILDQCRIHSL